MRRHIPLMVLSIALVSCMQLTSVTVLPEPTGRVPEGFLGEFYCMGHEYGLLAAAGSLTIREDGSLTLQWMVPASPIEGTWRYESALERITFSEDLELSYAVYDDVAEQLAVYLREGVVRAHVETGVMYCQRP